MFDEDVPLRDPNMLNLVASVSTKVLPSSFLLSRLECSDTQVYEPCIRARLGSAAHFCEEVVSQLLHHSLQHARRLRLTPYCLPSGLWIIHFRVFQETPSQSAVARPD